MTIRLLVSGRVQGVFYRAWSVAEAKSLGLSGWVRNRRDGRVEMVLAGDEQAIAEMVERCRRGPPSAEVAEVCIEPSDEPTGSSFEKRPTV